MVLTLIYGTRKSAKLKKKLRFHCYTEWRNFSKKNLTILTIYREKTS